MLLCVTCFCIAFDMASDYEKALEDIVTLGCERILTSGLDSSALEGTQIIKKCTELVSTSAVVLHPTLFAHTGDIKHHTNG